MSDFTLRRMGTSDLMLSPLGLGCWQFSKGVGFAGGFWPALPDDVVSEVVKASIEGGINWFDTAEVYGWGESEKVLAKSLAALNASPDAVRIATKWWPMFRTSRSILQTIDARKQALDDRPIDLHQVHQPFSFSSVRSQMSAMAELVKSGDIRYVGVSNFSAKAMREADRVLREHGLRLISNQVRYSLLDRRIEHNGILETAKELGIAIIAYSPLEQGLLTGKFHHQPQLQQQLHGPRKWMGAYKAKGLSRTLPLIEALERIGTRYQTGAAQVALNWLIHAHGETVFAIPGASKLQQALANVQAMQFTLSDAEIRELSEISAQCGARK